MWMFCKTTIRSCFQLILIVILSGLNLQAQNDSIPFKKLEEVVVTGQYTPQSVRNSVYRVRVIKYDQIKLRAATDVAGILNTELGIRFSADYTLGEADVNIMGMSGQNIKILLDGVPLVDRGSSKQSLSQIDINTIERIEMVEGPMSVVYGTDALAGVINIITKKVKGHERWSVAARIHEETTGNYYSAFANEGVHNENISINWQQKGWRLSGYGTRNTFGGYTDTAAFPAKVAKPKDQWLTGGTIGFGNPNLQAYYRLDYLHENIFVAGVMNINSYKGFDQYYITNRYTHQLQADWQISGKWKMSTALSYQDYKRNTESYQVNYTNGSKLPDNTPGAGYWDVSTFKTGFLRSTAQWFISSGVSLQPGIEIKSDKTTGQRIAGTPSITDYAVFVSAEIKPARWVSIRPGVRLSKNSVYTAPPVIPSLNAKLVLHKDLDLRLSYARGFRAPTLRELYFYFYDASHSIEGNPNLEAEYSNNLNGSLTWNAPGSKKGAFSSTLSLFYNDYNNRIDLATIGSGNMTTYVNISKYKTTGGTLDNTFTGKNLSASVGTSYIGRYNIYYEDAAFGKDSQSRFTWSPEINAGFTYHFPKLNGQVALFYKFTGKRPSYQASQGKVYLAQVESYHWTDVTISKTIFKYVTIQAGAKNLFNVTRLQNTTQDAGGAHATGGPVLIGYGRSYFAGLNFQWSKK
jgi:outer membrane receptor for ferrienterochelin and colicins